MITSIAFTMYPVSDMARSRAFYEQVLGLTPGAPFGEHWTEYELGESTFGITTVDIGHPPGSKGAVVAFETDDLDASVAALKAKGVSFVTEIKDNPACRLAMIEDPDGNHIMIHKRKGP
jgi:predicted enzyme related to lactoylglutathione lyase